MKERIGIRFGMTYIYLVFIRNFLTNGIFYNTYPNSFQKSLVYCFFLSVFITVILETWNMFLDKIKIDYFFYMLFIIPFLALTMMAMFKSLYYSMIIGYICFCVCKDCIRMYSMNHMMKKS